MNNITKFKTQNALTTGIGSALTNAKSSGKQVQGGGNYVKFTKGRWLAGAANVELEDVTFAVNPASFMHGYINWDQRDSVTAKLGEVMQAVTGAIPAEPAAIENGRWDEQWSVEFVALEGEDKGEAFIFNTSTYGGLAQLKGELAPAVGAQIEAGEDPVAIVRLVSDSYMHPNKKFGEVFTPVFDIVGWTPFDGGMEAAEEVLEDAPEEVAEEDTPKPRRRRRS